MTILVIVFGSVGYRYPYNLTNINVAERIRELSTIKVLGFHNNEVTLYIYRETIVLSLVGIVLGLVIWFLFTPIFDSNDFRPRPFSFIRW